LEEACAVYLVGSPRRWSKSDGSTSSPLWFDKLTALVRPFERLTGEQAHHVGQIQKSNVLINKTLF
jgi:hypothetical protein